MCPHVRSLRRAQKNPPIGILSPRSVTLTYGRPVRMRGSATGMVAGALILIPCGWLFGVSGAGQKSKTEDFP